jgi:hypothetical protein
VHAHDFDRYHNTQVTAMLDFLESHDTGLGYGMINL